MDKLTLFHLCDTDKGYQYSFFQRWRPVGLRDIIIVGDLITYNIGAFRKKMFLIKTAVDSNEKKKKIMLGRDTKNRCLGYKKNRCLLD